MKRLGFQGPAWVCGCEEKALRKGWDKNYAPFSSGVRFGFCKIADFSSRFSYVRLNTFIPFIKKSKMWRKPIAFFFFSEIYATREFMHCVGLSQSP